MELARAYPGRAAILCMDAMQVYRGADIGTSKPTVAERAEVPHGGLDLVEFGQSFDVAHYLRHAEAFLREQRAAGRRVIIVGGTGLYFRALTRGLCEAPQGSEELRRELSALSVAELRERLRKVDPGILERLDAANPRRLVRAIEVMEATGRSLRDWQEETPEPLVREFTAIWIQREKGELEARIAARVEAMFAQGWVEEVRGLVAKYGAEAVKGFAGIGYWEIGEGLERSEGAASCGLQPPGQQVVRATRGEEDSEAIELPRQLRSQMEFGNEGTGAEGQKAPPLGTAAATTDAAIQGLKRDILVATRQYAKRQLTWFTREPNLQAVMLTGNQPVSAVLPDLL
jgi:tRNA dimethylallyltransferase